MLKSSSSTNVTHFSTLSSGAIYLKIYELFIEKLNLKLCLVPLDPFSKKPCRLGWTDDDYNDTTFSWARHPGNIGVIPGRSKLLIIDCDNEETVNFFTKLAQEIDLSVDTLIVQTRRGKHFYYYCEFSHKLDKKQFSFNNIKLDVMAGNKCQVVAPYSLLKLDERGNILDARAENYILFEYTPVNIPQKLAELSREKYEALLAKLESSTQKSKKILRLPPYVEKSEKSEERELTDEEIEKLVEVINEYFVEGQRQNLILYLSGYLRKELNVSEESIYKLYEQLQPTDDPQDRKSRLAAIKKTFEKDPDQVSGWMGLIEILGEETARELCNKIKKTLKLPDEDKEPLTQTEETKYDYVELNRKKQKYARCNYNALSIEVGTKEKNEILDKYFFVVHYKAFSCCIEKIYVIENPLTGEESFEVHFVSKLPAKPRAVFKGTIQEIWDEMRAKTTYVLETARGLNILTAVLNYYLEKGKFERKQEELPPGFYYIDGQLIAQGFEEKEYTKEELQQAALFLNEYIYSHPNPHLIANIIRAGILLPFAFAQKQLVTSGKLRKRMKYLYLHGESKSGKTTTALLLACMWNQNNQIPSKISYASFCTEARASKYLSNSTHILVVDEVSKDLEISTVKELLKFAQEDIMARSIQSKSLKQINYPALAAIIMTSNSHFPEDPALLERFYIFKFRKTDKIASAQRARYEKEDFKVLTTLGQFIWKYVKKNGLRDDYIEYATEILKAFYQEAKVDADWLDWKFIHDTAETEEEQQYTKEAEFYNAVIKFFRQNVKLKENHDFVKSIYYTLKATEFGRWIWIDNKDLVNISRDFLHELKRTNQCKIRDLEELSALTGWEKTLKGYEYTKVWVVRTTAMDFFYRLNYIPKFLDTNEFKEWLAGKYAVEAPADPEPNLDKILEENKKNA